MTRRACALVEAGGVPGRNPLLDPLGAALAARGIELVAHDPTRPGWPVEDVPPADLYLVKGDHPLVLTAAGCLEDRGAPCLNTAAATDRAADKARALAAAAAAGVPVPATTTCGDRQALRGLLEDGPRVVKPIRGAHGTGVAVLGPGEADRAAPGPWLVQEVLEGPGYDLKVYGVQGRVAVRRMRFTPGVVDADRQPVDPDPALVRHAVAAAAALDLTCFGADFIATADGPVLVDVNAFPGYRSVPDAATWIADVVVGQLAGAAA